jgi:NADH-quinone oxidoreductase subunit K
LGFIKISVYFFMTRYTIFSFLLFLVGMLGIFTTRKNIIIILMSVELMLLAINVNFVVYSVYLDDLYGQVFALFVLTVAAAESAIGLALLVAYYRVKGTVATLFINNLKG